MATLLLNQDELAEVRLLVGKNIKEDMLTDFEIQSGVVLGAASDYVFEKVREGLDLSKLTDVERTIAERFRDETDDDIVRFSTEVLKPPQEQQMRRAVIYRSAGLCVAIVNQVISESAANITTRIQNRAWEVLQASLFTRADEEIERLRQAFPDDAFPTQAEQALAAYNIFSVTSG